MMFQKICYEMPMQDNVEKLPNVTMVWCGHHRCCWLIGCARFDLNCLEFDIKVILNMYPCSNFWKLFGYTFC